MLQQTLVTLGYAHISNYVVTLINYSFATQLESYDLWHWSIFIVLHLKEDKVRQREVMNLLIRNVKLDETSEYKEKEDFLKINLKICSKWINEAKAIKSYSLKRYVSHI